MKTCRICNQEKDESEFYPPKNRKVCKECQKVNTKKHYYEHQKEKIQYQIEYTKENKEKINKRLRKYHKNRRNTNPNFKISSLLRHQVWLRIKNQNGKKSNNTWNLLDCSINELKQHLQQTAIQNGYLDFDINNYSGKDYHIDHIIPCSKFNLKCSYHQKLCFHWSNLQILSAITNVQKHNHII